MIEFLGELFQVNIDYQTGDKLITFRFPKTVNIDLEDLKGKLSVKISKARNKRSLSANAYAWLLIDKLAEKMKLGKTEVYRKYIKEMPGICDIVCVKNEAVEHFCKSWESHGIGWITERSDSKLGACTNVKAYAGSSTFDAEQMARFIDLIIQDCKACGIETMTPDEIMKLEGMANDK